jgi:glycine betaine catabolism A
LIGAPHMEQPGFSRADYPLKTVAIDTWEGHIFLNFAAEPRPSGGATRRSARAIRRVAHGGTAPAPAHRLRREGQLEADRRELQRVPALPAGASHLNRLTDYLGADNEPPTPDYIGGAMGFRGGAETMSFGGVRGAPTCPDLSEEQQKMVNYYAIYPNLLLALHPDYMMVHTLWPKAADRTEIVCEWHFHPDEMAKPDFEGDDAVEFWDQANREDWGISELSQLGIASRGYTPGPYSRREELLHAFDRIAAE